MIEITGNPKGNIYAIIQKVEIKTAFSGAYGSYESNLETLFDDDLVMCTGISEQYPYRLWLHECPYFVIPCCHLRETTEQEKQAYLTQFVHHNID